MLAAMRAPVRFVAVFLVLAISVSTLCRGAGEDYVAKYKELCATERRPDAADIETF